MAEKPRTSVIYRGKYKCFVLYAREIDGDTGDLTATLGARPLAPGSDAIDPEVPMSLTIAGETFAGDDERGPGWLFAITSEVSIDLASGSRHLMQIDVVDTDDQPKASRVRILEVREPGVKPE